MRLSFAFKVTQPKTSTASKTRSQMVFQSVLGLSDPCSKAALRFAAKGLIGRDGSGYGLGATGFALCGFSHPRLGKYEL